MTADERREYHRLKQREYKERKAALYGKTISHHTPGSHPTKMSHEERLAYNRERLQVYKMKYNISTYDRK